MTALIAAFWPQIAAAAAVLGAIILAFVKGKSTGKQSERNKTAQQEQKARDTANKIDNRIAATDPHKNREELGKWTGR